MTFLELCKTVREEIGLSGTGPSTVVGQTGQMAQLVGFVKTADYMIKGLYEDWKFLWDEFSTTTVASQDTYASPVHLSSWDVESFYLNWGADGASKLLVNSYKDDRLVSAERSTGKPTHITLLPDGSLKLNPVPDGAYTLTAVYYKVPVMLSTNTDVSEIPAKFHRIIISRAKMLYAESEEIYQQMQANAIEYNLLLSRLEAYSLEGQRHNTLGQPDSMVVRAV